MKYFIFFDFEIVTLGRGNHFLDLLVQKVLKKPSAAFIAFDTEGLKQAEHLLSNSER